MVKERGGRRGGVAGGGLRNEVARDEGWQEGRDRSIGWQKKAGC